MRLGNQVYKMHQYTLVHHTITMYHQRLDNQKYIMYQKLQGNHRDKMNQK